MSTSPTPNNPVIKHIAIAGLRGIRKGLIENFAPISILVGPNGCGKSTVLDALMLAACPDPGFALGAVTARRPHLEANQKWMYHRAPLAHGTWMSLLHWTSDDQSWYREWSEGKSSSNGTRLRWGDKPTVRSGLEWLTSDRPSLSTPIRSPFDPQAGQGGPFAAPGNLDRGGIYVGASEVRLVDPVRQFGRTEFVHVISEITKNGLLPLVRETLKQLIPGFADVRLVEDSSEFRDAGGNRHRSQPQMFPFIEFESGPAKPLAVAGDGIEYIVRAVAEMQAGRNSLVLLEEPEAHLHPRAVTCVGSAISAVAQQRVQLVVTTHSLELIDAILAQYPEDRLDEVAIFKLGLKDGELSTFRFSGTEAAIARSEIEGDLR